MGFTRCWKQPHGISPRAWRKIIADTRTLLAWADIPLLGAAGAPDREAELAPGLPPCTDDEIAFTGVGKDGAELFVLRPDPSDFECVKTYGRPYDLLVAAVLVVAKHHAPGEVLDVSSDELYGGGDLEAWSESLDMCAAAGVNISRETVRRLRADVTFESEQYERPKSDEQLRVQREWVALCEGDGLKRYCEQRFSPKYLRYQATEFVAPSGLRLKLRRSIDARALPPTSPVLRQKVDELQKAWNEAHFLQIVEVVVG